MTIQRRRRWHSERAHRRRLSNVLRAALGTSTTDAELAAIALATPLDGLAELAAFHRVEGATHARLVAIDGLDPVELELLRLARQRAVQQHLITLRSLGTFAAAMASQEIPWVAFKGPVLASLLYGEPGLRTYHDLDVLVPQPRFADAIAALEGGGCEHLIHNWPAAMHFRASELTMAVGNVPVDVHWHLLYAWYERRSVALDPAAMLRRAVPVRLGSIDAATLDAEDTVVHLALHAMRAGAHRLVWMKDLERAITVGKPDLDVLRVRALESRLGPMVGVALARVQAVLGVDLPDGYVASLAGRTMPTIDRFVRSMAPIGSAASDKMLARLTARAVSTNVVRSAQELGRMIVYRGRERMEGRGGLGKHDPANPRSLSHDAGGEREKADLLRAVSTWT